MRFQVPRGTVDILPEEQKYWEYIQNTTKKISADFGYAKIDTPIFEDTGLFLRSVGESSDILQKETYTFLDRGGDSLTLRPEGTASVARAYVEHGMHNQPQPVRLFYLFENFRYERPQSGRYRSFHQFGVEAFGETEFYIDVEVIELCWNLMTTLGLNDLTLVLNSIGCMNCRPIYLNELINYFKERIDKMCPDCNKRINSNPLRILDCKQNSCEEFIESSPKSVSLLCNECSEHYEKVTASLSNIKIPFETDHKLVRGLDYYSKTVFEIVPPLEGRTKVLAGGGRYDGLIEQIDGPSVPGVGFAMGIERIIDNLKRLEISVPVENSLQILIACMGENAKNHGIEIAAAIRQEKISAIIGPSRGIKSQMKYASSIHATHVVIIGDDEINKQTYQVKNLNTGEQEEISQKNLINFFKKLQ